LKCNPALLYASRHISGRIKSTLAWQPIRENKMNPLETIKGTIIAGLVLAVVLVFVIKAISGA
jgi:hypothetical protein